MPIERSQVERWLREDVGHHDVTNDVPGETTGRLVATEAGVVAGLDAAEAVFEYLGVAVAERLDAGDHVEPGDVLLRVTGPAPDVLRGERVAVNVAGHASGIATRTRRAVEEARRAAVSSEQRDDTGAASNRTDDHGAAGTRGSDEVRIAGTRKTTPGLRGVEKRAVAAGGGDTHRLDLSHMVMVKDNHVAELGMEAAVERFRERASFATKIEVEVEAPVDAARAAEAGADVVLLDNMSPAETERAVESLPGDVLAEASGGITIDRLPAYAATGVDVISMGSLTHSAPSLDLSFRTD